jgi:hypothetical protein
LRHVSHWNADGDARSPIAAPFDASTGPNV